MTRAFLSSGDLIADRRASYAEMLAEAGDHVAAADLMRQALEIVPDWTAGLFRLAEMFEAAGDGDAAADIWREVLAQDPDDRFGAALKLAAAGHGEAPPTPPPAYVETLFDAYAPTFENMLLDRLEYRVPELLAASIEAAAPGRRYASVLDIGCGTGLMAPHLRPQAERLVGMDLSEAMLRQAAEKELYDELLKEDVNLFEMPADSVDLVVAADVFVYVGDLAASFATIAAILERGGLFAFSVERHDGSDDMLLQESLRYAHSEAHVRDLLGRYAMEPVSIATEPIRLDRGEYLQGLIVVARPKR
ncbi:methyltransferase domain-containing protein [Phyllobacterium sp. 21LDTY02-6]|uniref:class I SAM-dependent DNA methyltransferase n=1 Tax=Phyllobacterium sp. 21LDTY02-6 TaxID=2944903 RepID=UPI002020A841|nr:methyltransferase domain-containing protein [Phyllobacterium sp. 21LDTY02-6]